MREADLIKLGHTLGTVAMFGIVVLNRKFRRKRDYQLVMDELLRANRRELYLASILDKHGIEFDEFDIIALNEA